MIPQCGIESVPADVLSYALVSHIRKKLNSGVTECVNTLQVIKSQASGGTLATILTLMDTYSLSHLAKSMKPHALSPIDPPSTVATPKASLLSMLLGVRNIPDLGVLTDSPQGSADASIVHRSWGILDSGALYGTRFYFTEWMRARNMFTGILVHFAFMFGLMSLLFPPVRWALKKIVFQPGHGPDLEKAKNDHIAYKAIAKADTNGKRAVATFEYPGSMYVLTGICIAEAAMVILRSEGEIPARNIGGGILTPATLGEPFAERLQKSGVQMDVKMLDL